MKKVINFPYGKKFAIVGLAVILAITSCKSYKLRDAFADSTAKRIHLLTVAVNSPKQLFEVAPAPSTSGQQAYTGMSSVQVYNQRSQISATTPLIQGGIVKSGPGCSGPCIESDARGFCKKFAGPKLSGNCPNCKIIPKPISSTALVQGLQSTISKQILADMKGTVEPQSVSEKLPGFKEIRKILDTEIAARFHGYQNPFESSTVWEGFFFDDPRWKEFLAKNPGEAFLIIKVPVEYSYQDRTLLGAWGKTENRFNCENKIEDANAMKIVSGINYLIYPFLYSAHDPKLNLFFPKMTTDVMARPKPIEIDLSQSTKIEGKIKKMDWELGKIEYDPVVVNPVPAEKIVAEAIQRAPEITKVGIQSMLAFIEKEKQQSTKK